MARVLLCLFASAALLVGGWARTGSTQIVLAHSLLVDVPAVEVQGDFLLNGVLASNSAGELAAIGFEDGIGDQVTLGLSSAQSYGPLWIIPANYQPTYDFFFSSSSLPVNPESPFGVLTAVDGLSDVDLDIPSVSITFDFLLNGSPFPVVPGEAANFILRESGTEREFVIAPASAGVAVVSILPGTYDILYTHIAGSTVPQNEHALIVSNVDLGFAQQVVVDVTAFTHIVSATLNGAAFPASIYEDGEIHLRNFETGDAVSFGLTSAGSGSRMIIPGTYDATYSRDSGGTIGPANSKGIVAEGLPVVPPSMGQLSLTSIDVQTVSVTLDATLDGGNFPASIYETGDVVLTTPEGDEVTLGSTHDANPPTLQVITDRYDVYYRSQAGGTVAPGNTNARIAQNVQIDASRNFTIDVETALLTFEFVLDGVPFPVSIYERGNFSLAGGNPGEVIPLGSTHNGPLIRRVIVGIYDLVYDHGAGTLIVPLNTGHHAARNQSFLVDQTVVTDLTTKPIIPTFMLNGAPFPNDPAQRGRIVLRDPDGGEVNLGTTDPAVPDSVIGIEGAYGIDYEWDAGVDVPRNQRRRIGYTSVPEPGAGGLLAVGMLAFLGSRRLRRRLHA